MSYNPSPSLKDLYSIITAFIPILKMIREEREKKKIGKEIIESIEPLFKNAEKKFIEVISDVFSIIGIVLFIDYEEFEKMVDDIVSKISRDIEKLNEAYIELFEAVGLYRDTLKDVLGLEKWSVIEPLVNMAMYNKQIDWVKLEEIGYFDRVTEKIYGDTRKYLEFLGAEARKKAELLQEKLEPIMKKYGIDVMKEMNVVTELLTKLPKALSLLKEDLS